MRNQQNIYIILGFILGLQGMGLRDNYVIKMN